MSTNRAVRKRLWVALVSVGVLLPTTCAAETDILQYLPEDAYGFVLIRNLATTSERAEQLAKLARYPLPPVLALFKTLTGMNNGLDDQGDMLVALIPGAHQGDPPEPMVLVPTKSYLKLAAEVGADITGKPSQVPILFEQILVAKQGPYAMLMDIEQRETFELILSLDPAPVEFLNPWQDWLGEQQVVFCVMPEGINELVDAEQSIFDSPEFRRGRFLGPLHHRPFLAGLWGQFTQGAKAYQAALEVSGDQCQAMALGVRVDKETNLRLEKRLLLNEQLAASEPEPRVYDPLAGFADEPFVLAGGSTLPTWFLPKLFASWFEVQRSAPEVWQLEALSEELWEEYEDRFQTVGGHIKHGRVVMLPGKEGEPLLSNLYGVLGVDDAEKFLESYRSEVEIRNQVLAQTSGDIELNYELEEGKLDERRALEESVDIANAAGDPDVPQLNWIYDAVIGEDGKLQIHWVVADKQTIVVAIAEKEQLTEFLQRLEKGEQSLANSNRLATTKPLLSQSRAGEFYVSPTGSVQWINRVLAELISPLLGQEQESLRLSRSAPVGLSLSFPEQQYAAEMIVPATTIKALFAPKPEAPAPQR